MTNAGADRIDLFILTGFLGSGKTTLLNGLLRNPHFADTAVIVNEFGEIGVDNLIISAASGDVVLLDSGCLCCAAGESFADTLLSLWVKRARGEIPPFKRVIIETSGLAEPFPIAVTVMKNGPLSARFRYGGTITVVDALFGSATLREHCEAVEQLRAADVVILSKLDEADADTGPLAPIMLAENPSAPVLRAEHGIVDVKQLFDYLKAIAPFASRAVGSHAHSHGASALQQSFTSQQRVTWQAIATFSQAIKQQHEPLLRCKGLLAVENEAAPVLVQAVRNVVEVTRLDCWPDADQRSRIVCIFSSPPQDFPAFVGQLFS